MRSIFKLNNQTFYSILKTHQKTCTQDPHPWCRPCPWENDSTTNHFLGEFTHSRDCKKKHSKLFVSLITFYPMHGCANWCHETSLTLSMENWLNAMCHCQCHFPHSDLHFYHPLTCISLNHVCPFITNYLIGSIHFSPILKENLYHLLAPFLRWYVQGSNIILRSPTWSANKCWTISISCPIFSHSTIHKHNIDCVKE